MPLTQPTYLGRMPLGERLARSIVEMIEQRNLRSDALVRGTMPGAALMPNHLRYMKIHHEHLSADGLRLPSTRQIGRAKEKPSEEVTDG